MSSRIVATNTITLANIGETVPDWVTDWESGKTVIKGNYILTPKIYAGTVIEDEDTLKITGVYMGPDISGAGLYGYNDGEVIFQLNSEGGKIGGWSIAKGGIVSSTGKLEMLSEGTILAYGPENEIAWALYEDGNARFANGNILFYADGSAYYKGEIDSGSGSIGGWSISERAIYKDHILLDANKSYIGISLYSITPDDIANNDYNHKDNIKSDGGVAMFYDNANSYGLIGYLPSLNNQQRKVFSVGSENCIAGWYFDENSIYIGTKNNTAKNFTNVDSITIGSEGLRGETWYIDKTGAFSLGKGAFEYDGATAKMVGWSLTNKRFSGKYAAVVSESNYSGIYLTSTDISSVASGSLMNAIGDGTGMYIHAASNILNMCGYVDGELVFRMGSNGNTIGGWHFNGSCLYSGDSSEVDEDGFAGEDCIVLQEGGIHSHTWNLLADGSGSLANGNISWSANGTTHIKARLTIQGGSSGLDSFDEWEEVNNRINQALESLNKLNDDTYLTLDEKKTIRIEWIAINGIASTTESSNTGTFYKARKALIAYELGEPKVSYNSSKYQYGASDVTYDFVGLVALDAAYLDLRNYLENIQINTDDEYPAFNKTTYAELLKNYYDCEADVYYYISEALRKEAENLKKKMEEFEASVDGALTKTMIENGFVTTGSVLLADINENVKAGITGGGNADTSIRIWAGSSLIDRASAPFRVTQGGKLYATDAEITGKIMASSGNIGSFEISDGKLQISNAKSTYSGGEITYTTILKADEYSLTSTNIKSSYSLQEFIKIYASSNYGALLTASSMAFGDTGTTFIEAPIVLNLTAQVRNAPSHKNEHAYIVRSTWGEFAGLRPAIRRIESDAGLQDYQLSNLDYVIVYNKAAENTLTLPFSPAIGQTFRIIKTSTASSYRLTVTTGNSSHSIVGYDYLADHGGAFASGYVGVKEYIFDGSKWHSYTVSAVNTNSIYEPPPYESD